MRKKILLSFLGILVLLMTLSAWKCPSPSPIPEFVEVDVCTESGMVPGEYCKSIETRKFEKGKQPTAVCNVCAFPKPAPGPPWIGTSCYQAIVFPLDEVEAFIKNVALNEGNCTEFFLVFTWPIKKSEPYGSYSYSGWRFQPYKIACYEPDPDRYGDYQFPMSDLKSFREEIWEKWTRIFEFCEKYGVAPIVRIQDYCSVKDPFYKRHYAFNRNIQKGHCGHSKILTGGMWGEPIKPHYSDLNRRLIQALEAASVTKYFIVPMNEADVLNGSWSGGEAKRNERCIDFHKFYIDDLRSLGCPKDRIIINTSRAFNELRKLGHVMELHGVNSDITMRKYIEEFGTDKITLNGDGPDSYAEGRQGDKASKREPSIAQAEKMRLLIIENNILMYCYFNRDIEHGIPDIKRAKFDVLRALTGRQD